jgi:magnesium transporter
MLTFWKQDSGLKQLKKYEKNSWINVVAPTQEEISYLTDIQRVPLDFITDILDIDERSRSEVEGRWLLIIIRIPVHSKQSGVPYYTIPLGVLISMNSIITICLTENDVLRDIFLLPKYRFINLQNKVSFVLQLFLSSATCYLRYLKDINRINNEIENELVKYAKNKELHYLLKMEKCLVYFVTSLKSNELLLYKLQRSRLLNNQEVDEDLMEDVITEYKQAIEISKIYSDIQAGMMDTFASVISNNVNIVMKQLTSVTIILMIPTLIASLYGMNVPNSLENNNNAFWIILAISSFITLLGVLFFRRRNWF